MALVYQYNESMFHLPQSIHQWRQADCLSLATNYYDDQNPFLEPSVHYLGEDGTGKTLSEFPIIYYTVAKIWKITGRNIWVYRLVVALMFFFGLLAMVRMVEQELQNSFAGLFTGLLLFTSPVLVYYSNNFLMNIPALSLAMAGLYFFYRYKRNQVSGDLIWSCVFYTFAALLKVSSLISFIAILILYLLEFFQVKVSKRKIFKQKFWEIGVMLSVLIIPFLWYQYAVFYNSRHTGGIFLIGILPIWKLTMAQITETWRYIIIHLQWDYFRPIVEVMFAILSIWTLIFQKWVERPSLLLLVLVGSGSLGFCLLFYEALQWHDYYIIDLYILIPLLLLCFFQSLKTKFPYLLNSALTPIILLVVLIHSADFSRRRILERYDINDYRNLHHRDIFQAFSELEPLLQELNIEKDVKVLSLSDYSINITLYLMNRKGWTDYGISMNPERIAEKIEMGAEYLFIADQKTKENPVLEPYLQSKIGGYKNIEIYALPKASSNLN